MPHILKKKYEKKNPLWLLITFAEWTLTGATFAVIVEKMKETDWTDRSSSYSSQEEGFSLITLAIANFLWTGRVCQGKQHNKARMNGWMKERKGWSLNMSDNLRRKGLEQGLGNFLIVHRLPIAAATVTSSAVNWKASSCSAVSWKGKGSVTSWSDIRGRDLSI